MKRTAITESGIVKGLQGSDARITVYKGIPFAAPPVGENRWRAPKPVQPWEGEREAYTFGPIPVQDTPGMGDDLYCREWHVDCDLPMSEDCLYLNIWTPAKKTDEKLPVLVWYFGGGFQWGYTAEMEFDGERIASRGIVVVSVAYRLGAIGFMAHSELTKEEGVSGNYGFLDQKAGLEWVYRNIAAFGGNPERITISGQSAGGCSVMNQLTCEENFDKIKGAVIMSGIIRFPQAEREKDLFCPTELDKAEKKGEDFLEYLGVKNIEEARKLDAIFIRDKYAKYRDDHQTMFVGIKDGRFCVGDPVERIINGDCAPCAIMTGNTKDEFVFGGSNMVERSVKETLDAAMEKDPARKFYYYSFSPDIPGDDNPGCFHSCDLWFWFETLLKCRRAYQGRHFDLARQMCNYISSFVKTGDPNCADNDGTKQPEWKTYTKAGHEGVDFTGEGTKQI